MHSHKQPHAPPLPSLPAMSVDTHYNPSPDACNPSSDSYPCHSLLLLLGFVLLSFLLLRFFTIYVVRYALKLIQITTRSCRPNASRISGSGMSSALPPSDNSSGGLDRAILSSLPIFTFTAGRLVVVPADPSIPERRAPSASLTLPKGRSIGCSPAAAINSISSELTTSLCTINTCPVCRRKLDSGEKPPLPHGEDYQHRNEQVAVMVEEAARVAPRRSVAEETSMHGS